MTNHPAPSGGKPTPTPPSGGKPAPPSGGRAEPADAATVGSAGIACAGTAPPDDHPLVWLAFGPEGEICCPYCSRRFRLVR